VIRRGEKECEELCVRTHLASDLAVLRQYTAMSPDQVLELAGSSDLASRARLIPLLATFEYETAFRPCNALPYAAQALEFGKGGRPRGR